MRCFFIAVLLLLATCGITLAGVPPRIYVNQPPTQVNVQSAPFNATGNGVTDDTAAIQAAINAAAPSFGTLVFPKGNYLISSQIVLTGDVSILGADEWQSRLFAAPGYTGTLIKIMPASVIHHSIQSIYFQNTNAGAAPLVHVLANATGYYTYTLYDRCRFDTTARESVLWDGFDRTGDKIALNRVRDCLFLGGIRATNVGDSISFVGNTFADQTTNQVAIDFCPVLGSVRCVIRDNNITANQGVIIRNAHDGIFSGNNCEFFKTNANYYASSILTFSDDVDAYHTGNSVSTWTISDNTFNIARVNRAVIWPGFGLSMHNNYVYTATPATPPILLISSGTGENFGRNSICDNLVQPPSGYQVDGDIVTTNILSQLVTNRYYSVTYPNPYYVLPHLVSIGQSMATNTSEQELSEITAPASVGTNQQGASISIHGGNATGTNYAGFLYLDAYRTETNSGPIPSPLLIHRVQVTGDNTTTFGKYYNSADYNQMTVSGFSNTYYRKYTGVFPDNFGSPTNYDDIFVTDNLPTNATWTIRFGDWINFDTVITKNGVSTVGAFSGKGSGLTNLEAVGVGVQSTVVGAGAGSSGPQSTAYGNSATASGSSSTAVGVGATASANFAVTVGGTADGYGGTALGISAVASGSNSIAIGASSFVSGTGTNSAAIGAGVSVTRTNLIQLGTAATDVAVGRDLEVAKGFLIKSNTFPCTANFANLAPSSAILWNSNGVHGYWVVTNSAAGTVTTNVAW